jgi:hypothetical protein
MLSSEIAKKKKKREEEKKEKQKKGKEAKYSLLYCVFHLQNKKNISLLCPFCVKRKRKETSKKTKQSKEKRKSGTPAATPACCPLFLLFPPCLFRRCVFAAWEFFEEKKAERLAADLLLTLVSESGF